MTATTTSARSDLSEPGAPRPRLRTFLHGLPGVDQVGAEQRAAMLGTRSIKTTRQGLGDRPGDPDGRPDHPGGRRHPGQGARAVRQGAAPRPGRPDLPARSPRSASTRMVAGRGRGAARQPACTWPAWRPRSRPARRRWTVKLADTRRAVAAGADEIDMVINRGAFLAGRYLRGLRRDRGGQGGVRRTAHLKVILETGELATYDNVRRASWLAMLAGADFIKTSTGKVAAGRDAAGDAGDAGGGPRLPGRAPGGRSASSRPAASGPPRTRSSTWCMVNETAGDGLAGPGLVPLRRLHACSTTC